MAVVYSPNIIEIAVVAEYAGRPHVNVWHMWFDPELGTDTKEQVVGDFRDNWQDHVLDATTGEYELLRFEWRSLDSSDATVGVVTPDPLKPLFGALASAPLPPNVALLINKRTENRPRGQRDGRMFLAGLPESLVSASGAIDAAMVQQLQGNFDAFYNGISDTSGTGSGDRYPAVLETTAASRAPGAQPVTINSRRVTSLPVDPIVSTQRDRLR